MPGIYLYGYDDDTKENVVEALSSMFDRTPVVVGSSQKTVPEHLAAKAGIGQTEVLDINYQVLATDVDVVYMSLTATRIVKLCDVDVYPKGQDLVISDESGACSETVTITIVPGDGTGDTIPQTSNNTIVLNAPYASVRLRRGAANLWKIV